MILVDTGPFVALFDPKDGQHRGCKEALSRLREPLVTTIPVLTEVFHMLPPQSFGAARLRDFLLRGGASVWFMDQTAVERCFELMERYADHPMDLADASLVAAAEALPAQRIFTIDRGDFLTYRARRGHRSEPFGILP